MSGATRGTSMAARGAYLWAAVVLFALVASAHALTLRVTSPDDITAADSECTLREAIDAANSGSTNECGSGSGAGDVILIDFDITPVLFLTDTGLGSLDVTQDLVITGENGRPVIDALSLFNVMTVSGSARLTLNNMEVRNGVSNDGDLAAGLTNTGTGALTLNNCVFRYNHFVGAVSGTSAAGAVLSNGAVQVVDSEFHSNSVEVDGPSFGCGGAITAFAGVTVSRCEFEYNRADDTSFSFDPSSPVESCAGAIYVESAFVNVADSSFVRNSGITGGAICGSNSPVVVDDTELIENEAFAHGGALFSHNDISIDGGATIPSVVGNVASSGNGGVAISLTGSVSIDTVDQLTRNVAGADGGVAWAYVDASVNVVSHDIAQNRAGLSGGVLYAGAGSGEISYVGGAVFSNFASYGGGVIQAYDSASLRNINLYVSHNRCYGLGGLYGGGVISVANAIDQVVIENTGSIYENSAADGNGGVVFAVGSLGEVRIDNIRGDIRGNQALDGGFATVIGLRTILSNVQGSVRDNYAEGSGGVLVVVGEDVTVSNIYGDVSRNVAGEIGGVVASQSPEGSSSVELEYVSGSVLGNSAGAFGGVIFASSGDVSVRDITGDISENSVRGRAVFDYVQFGRYFSRFQSLQDGGGVVYAGDGDIVLRDVGGGIINNTAGSTGFGGVLCALGEVEVYNIGGGVTRNTGIGSLVYSYALEVSYINGDISYNSAPVMTALGRSSVSDDFQTFDVDGGDARLSEVSGSIVANVCTLASNPDEHLYADVYNLLHRFLGTGVIAGSFASITNVSGGISYNSCIFGGVLRALDTGIIQNVGDLHHNYASSGGVALSTGGNIELRYTGDISYNSSSEEGGVISAFTSFSVVNVGRIVGNKAAIGGVAFAQGGGFVSSTRDIEHNSAVLESGGAFFVGDGSLAIEHVDGNVMFNSAVYSGGFAYAYGGNEFSLTYVSGLISYNTAALGRGGAVFAAYFEANIIRNVGGFTHNLAGGAGGAVAASGPLLIYYVNGDISNNASSAGDGGAVYCESDLDIRGVSGSIAGNSGEDGGALWSGGLFSLIEVYGDIAHNQGQYGGAIYASEAVIIDVGNVESNVAAESGGAVYADSLFGINWKNISDNSAGEYGGAVYAGDFFDMRTVRDMSGNFAGAEGGVAYSRFVALYYSGSLTRNKAVGGYGGVLLGLEGVFVEDVSGDISYNSAQNGGVIASGGNVTLRTVHGSVVYNVAIAADGVGGVIVTGDGVVSMQDVDGNVSYNSAGAYGGVVFSFDAVHLWTVGGSVVGNEAGLAGGVAAATSSVELKYVGGSVKNNRTHDGGLGGGVLFGYGTTSLVDVGGSVTGNAAAYTGRGGVLSSLYSNAYLENIGGDLSTNHAGSDGGVAHAGYSVYVLTVGGAIADNASGGRGGVVCANESASILDVGGAVERNTASGHGGVLFGGLFSSLRNVGGSVQRNRSGDSGGVMYVYRGDARLSAVQGHLQENRAQVHGGVIYANANCSDPMSEASTDIDITRIYGSILYNTTGLTGGVVTTRGCTSNVFIGYVEGDVAFNSAESLAYSTAHGGVVYQRGGFGSVLISQVAGSVSNNTATTAYSRDSYGGIVSAYGSLTRIENIGGSVSENRSAFGGGVFQYTGDVRVHTVTGDISYNLAEEIGGFIHAEDAGEVRVYNIGGSVRWNRALSRHGGFIYSDDDAASVALQNVSGSVQYNSSAEAGGIIYSRNSVLIADITGSVSHNSALNSYGGAVYASNQVLIERIGGLSYNYALENGGAVYCGGNVVMNTIRGDLSHNKAVGDGGAIYSEAGVLVQNVRNISFNQCGVYSYGGFVAAPTATILTVLGDICNNGGGFGGVVATLEDAYIGSVSGSVCNNKAQLSGGVIYSESGVSILRSVSGDVIGSTAVSGDGGVIWSLGDSATVRDVLGRIEASSAVYGGVIMCPNGDALIAEIGGGIIDATARESGGAVYASNVLVTGIGGDIDRCVAGGAGGFAVAYGNSGVHSVVIDGVVGSITDCLAQVGGVAYTDYAGFEESGLRRRGVGGVTTAITIRNVSGDIARNIALDSYGGVAASYSERYGPVLIENVGGSVTENEALLDGGVVYTDAPDLGDVLVRNVDGDISFNKARRGSGGVVYSADDAEFADIGGRICSNTAYIDGGVAVARTGSATLVNVGDGPIQDNRAGDEGGVLWALNDALVDAGNGIIIGNSPDVVHTAMDGVTSVVASVIVDGAAPAVSIISQPGDGLENTPLPQQPEVIVTGAQPGHELPLRIVVVEEGGVETVLDGPFNAVFGATAQFQDIAVPFVASNISLRFELVTRPCNSTQDTVLSSATSSRFDVGECASPAPVVCPGDIEVGTKQHECSAFVAVPGPVSSRCSNPTVTHSESSALLDELAVGEFELGSTLVEYTVENSRGVDDSCVVEVVVVDREPPEISCPRDIVVSSDPGQCGANVQLDEPEVSDNCGGDGVSVSSDHPGAFFTVGTTSVTFTAEDDGGNFASCTMAVTVIDVEPPAITCPSDVVLDCGALPSFAAPQGTDNCPGSQTFQRAGTAIGSTTPLPPGVTTFEFEVIDAVGERAACRFRVTTASDWYLDADGDGVGQSGAPITQCPAPGPNYVQDRTGDCDDTNPNLVRLLYPDADEDGYGNTVLAICSPPAEEEERRGLVSTVLIVRGGDCDDSNPDVNPGQIELCNGIDDNCNGQIDEGCVSPDSPPSIPTMPLPPAAPLAPEASQGTIIILPTPRPRTPPPAPGGDIIIVQPAIQSASAGSSLSVIFLFVLAAAVFNVLW